MRVQLSKTFDNIFNGKVTSLEVTVMYDPKDETAELQTVFAVQANTGVKDGKRWEDVPSSYFEITQVLEDFFPDTLDKMEDYDWSMVYAEHEDLTYKEIAA